MSDTLREIVITDANSPNTKKNTKEVGVSNTRRDIQYQRLRGLIPTEKVKGTKGGYTHRDNNTGD